MAFCIFRRLSFSEKSGTIYFLRSTTSIESACIYFTQS